MIILLLLTFFLAAATSFVVVLFFRKPVASMLKRIIADEIQTAWVKYVTFAIYVVGISGGVRVWELEKYISGGKGSSPLVLTSERWILEIYRTIIESLQSIAWMLLVFFIFALIAYTIVRISEMKHTKV